MSQQPTVAVVGLGAIGVMVTAGLEQAARASVLTCVRTQRPQMSMDRLGEMTTLQSRQLSNPFDVTHVDWVFCAVKAHQVPGTADWLAALVGPSTRVVALQNGVEHIASLSPFVSPDQITPTIIWVSAEAKEPGMISFAGELARLSVPDDDGGRGVAALLGGSFVEVTLVDDLVTEAWRKLVINAVLGLQVLAGRRAEMFHIDAVADLAVRYAAECVAVGNAAGAALDERFASTAVSMLQGLPGDTGSSILFDRAADRPLEWEARNGVIRRLGQRYGIATPISDVVIPLLQAASSER